MCPKGSYLEGIAETGVDVNCISCNPTGKTGISTAAPGATQKSACRGEHMQARCFVCFLFIVVFCCRMELEDDWLSASGNSDKIACLLEYVAT